MKAKIKHYLVVFTLLAIFSYSSMFVFSVAIPNEEDYLVITVAPGDSLWEIALKYKDYHRYSTQDFVEWVEKKNYIFTGVIKPGEEIKVPVLKKDVELLVSN